MHNRTNVNMVSQTRKKGKSPKTIDLSPRQTSMSSKKKGKGKKIIDLTSSNVNSMSVEVLNEKSIRSPNAEADLVNSESALDRKLSSFMEIVMEGINNLTKVMTSPSAMIRPTSIDIGRSGLHTPRGSTQANRKETAKAASCKKRTQEQSSNKTLVLSNDSLKKRLFSQTITGKGVCSLTDMEPLHNAVFDGMKETVKIPKWIPMLFSPPPEVILDEVKAMVVAYLFGSNKDDSIHELEPIVETSTDQVVNRKSLKSLVPMGFIDPEVLNLVATYMTYNERLMATYPACLYLPTTFAKYVLGGNEPSELILTYFEKNYIGKVDFVGKIFVPINDKKHHWYLLVVDFLDKKLVVLDSKPEPKMNRTRRRYARKLAIVIEEMFLDQSLYEFDTSLRPEISGFELVTPQYIGEQRHLSNDCGVWVATWMIESGLGDDYIINVNDASRMKIALALVLGPHNLKKNHIIQSAATNWKTLEDKKKCLLVSN